MRLAFGFPTALPLETLDSTSNAKFVWGKAMQIKEAYLDRLLGEVEELAGRVQLLKCRFARLKVSVKLEHHWELAYIQKRFAEFKWRIEQLEGDDDLLLKRDQAAIEAAWNDLIRAVDMLLAAIPETVNLRNADHFASGDKVAWGRVTRAARYLST
jgi:hypothetical protein